MDRTAPQTVLDALASNHRDIEAELGEAGRSTTPDDEQAEQAEVDREQLVNLLVRHFVAEEQYLYPVVRQYLTDGDVRADDGFAQNRTCEKALRLLEEPDLSEKQIAAALDDVRLIVTDHIRVQEQDLFPALRDACPPERLAELTDEVLGAEQLAPTRPRRLASASAPVNKVESFLEGYLDHVRDYYSRRGVDVDPEYGGR